jgi:heme exporter protein B
VSTLRAAWLIAVKDFRLELRTWHSLVAMLALALAVIFAFAFTLGQQSMARLGPERLVPAVLWITLVFAALVGFRNSFTLESEREAISGLRMAPVDRSAIYLGKLAANFATVLILEAALVPLCAVFFGIDLLAVAPALALVLTLHTFGLCVVGTLLGGLVSRIRRGEGLFAILLLPLIIPLLISAGKTTSAALSGQGLGAVRFWMVLAVAFGAILTSLGMLLFEYLLEE